MWKYLFIGSPEQLEIGVYALLPPNHKFVEQELVSELDPEDIIE